jgi:hypothetical protein
MLIGSLPYDYLRHFDRHDRGRRKRTRPTDSRVRRGKASASGE